MTRQLRFSGAVLTLLCALVAGASNARDDARHSARIIDVNSQTEKSDIVSIFQKDLHRIGYSATIDGCDIAIDYFENMPSGRDSSVGAVCRIRSANVSASLIMCDDRLVGKFTLAPGTASRDELADFIGRNCPPGG